MKSHPNRNLLKQSHPKKAHPKPLVHTSKTNKYVNGIISNNKTPIDRKSVV